MTELDFDELDKAVNNLMTNVDTTKRNTSLDDPEDKVVELDAPADDVSAPAVPIAPAAMPAAGSAPTTVDNAQGVVPAATPATRRRGQFMDVMHPSSDMSTPAKPVSRQGVTLQPTAPVIPEASAPEQPTPQSDIAQMPSFDMESTGITTSDEPAGVAVEPATDPVTEPTAENAVPDMPDPIDLAMQSDASVHAEEEVLTESAKDEAPVGAMSLEDAKMPDTSAQEASTEPSPLTSPFLPDAKVEKRPLGELSTETEVAPVVPEAVETPADTAPADSSSPEPMPLPAELHTDVMALEATSTTSPATDKLQDTASTAAPQSEAAVPAGGSIPQQYTEAPNTGDQTNGSIYDTKEYHQPVEAAKPAKKASALTWIIWVLVLLIIGAGAGAAYFYFTR